MGKMAACCWLEPGAQRQLPVGFILLCINGTKAPGGSLLPQPHGGAAQAAGRWLVLSAALPAALPGGLALWSWGAVGSCGLFPLRPPVVSLGEGPFPRAKWVLFPWMPWDDALARAAVGIGAG